MGAERTPDEWAAYAHHDARIRQAIRRGVEDLASMFAAQALDLEHEACERLVNQLYDRLRSALSPDDLLRALVTEVLAEPAQERACHLICQFRELPELPERKEPR